LLASTGGHVDGARRAASAGTSPAAVVALSAAADAAVLPAKVADEVRVAALAAPLRSTMVLAAIVAVLVGLPAVLRRRATAAGSRQRSLRARRHTIALRAPPLTFA